MSTDTLDLPGLFKKEKADLPADLTSLISYLRGRGWRTAREVRCVLGFEERYTRLLASESFGKIIGSSQGYKITDEATPEEMNEWRGRQTSQIRATQNRMSITERVWHGRRVA